MADYKLGQFQRNNYFYGKLMTVRDFEAEQGYMNEKRHLLNRMVDGVGIICGLTPDDVEISNAGGNIKIKFKTGGAAIDAWGREIVVPIEDNPRDIRIKQGSTQTALTAADLVNDTYYLYLEYDPGEGEMVSSAAENSGCEETCCPSRIIEDFQVIASTAAPDTLTIACPDFTGESTEYDAKQKIKKWLMDQTSRLCSVPVESKIFFLALKKGSALNIDQQKTAQYITFVANNRVLSELLACHLADFENPHKTSAAQVGALVSVDGVANPGGSVDLIAQNSISITPDPVVRAVVIGETHSSRTDNPHNTTAEQVDALSTKGGFVTGPIHIRTKEWNALTGEATKTYGVMGRLTEDLDTGSDYRIAGVVGISEIKGKHGVYAKAPEVSHALYVEGTSFFTGPKTGYVVDIFKNASGKALKTGDVVKLKGTPISRFFGDNDKIPVPEVTFSDQENDNRTIGIVDRKAVPDNEESAAREKPGAFASIKNGEELYVVTLGAYAHCKVDAANAPIEVGDLLTSSKNPGYAQKAVEPQIGTIIGKALEPLEEGTGSIAVFVNIQ